MTSHSLRWRRKQEFQNSFGISFHTHVMFRRNIVSKAYDFPTGRDIRFFDATHSTSVPDENDSLNHK